MPSKLYCNLCLTPCNEYELLQNDEGDFNNIYEITIKYFDPILLTTERKAGIYHQKIQILCQGCWMPIKSFSEFQKSVIRARLLLEETVVKVEYVDQDNKINNHKHVDENCKSDDDVADCDYNDYLFENIYVKTDLDLEDDNNEKKSANNEDDDDDEKPLITLRNESINRTDILLHEKQEEIPRGEECFKPKRKGRIPKQIKSDDLIQNKATNTDQDHIQKKKVKLNYDKKDKGKSALNLEKARESDAFIAKWKPVLECDLCDETSSSFDKLRVHFKEKHKTRFYIRCCERKFYRRYVLVNHIQLHLNPETHKCDICGK